MTLDYTKMFLIVTEEAVVKGHFTGMHQRQLVTKHFLYLILRIPVRFCSCKQNFSFLWADSQLATRPLCYSNISARFVPAEFSRTFLLCHCEPVLRLVWQSVPLSALQGGFLFPWNCNFRPAGVQ